MKVVCLQHVPFEGPGFFAKHLENRGVPLTCYLVPQDGLPPHSGDLLIVMGGPMSVNDPTPWIEKETVFLKEAMDSGVPVLGICLGSQLMAKALGAQIYPGPKPEIGMTSITLTEEGRQDPILKHFPHKFSVFEWHGEVFDLPPGALALASSELVPTQAFRYGLRAYGLLFHLEMEQSGIQAICQECTQDVEQGGLSVSSIIEQSTPHLPQLHAWAAHLLDRMLAKTR